MDPIDESAWNRVQKIGIRSAGPADLLAVGLCRRPEDAGHFEETAKDIFKHLGSIRALGDLSAELLRERAGLSQDEAFRAMAWVELGRRIGLAGKGERKEVVDAEAVWEILSYLRDEKREHFVALMLDAKNQMMRVSTIHIGTLTTSIVGPREVFREAVREGASSLIVAHNHPSGNPEPSAEDIAVTARLVEVGQILDMPLLDHVIVGEHAYVSLRTRGLIR